MDEAVDLLPFANPSDIERALNVNRRVCRVAFLDVGRDRVDHALHTGDRSGDALFFANVGCDWNRPIMSGRNKAGAEPLWVAHRDADDFADADEALDDAMAEKARPAENCYQRHLLLPESAVAQFVNCTPSLGKSHSGPRRNGG